MKLKDIVDIDLLDKALNERLVNVRYSDDGMRIYNYSDTAVFTPGSWDNPAVRLCRGLIVDSEDNVVARSWSKFFNHNQPEAGELDFSAPVEVTDKKDGSLGIIHRDASQELRVATRGSFESDQAKWATEWLRRKNVDLAWVSFFTPLVEIVYPENRIVCDYGDYEGLILLGTVEIETGRYLGPYEAAEVVNWPFDKTEVFEFQTFRDALAAPPREGAEGLCVRFKNKSEIVKIKQDDYVQLHRLVTGLNERVVWEHMMKGDSLESLLAPLPDELHQWTKDVWSRLGVEAREIEVKVIQEHLRIEDTLPDDATRKDYAMEAQKLPDLRGYLFALKDGKQLLPMILKTLKPSGANRAKAVSEDVA